MAFYDFSERLVWSDGVGARDLLTILRSRIPGALRVERAEKHDDRNGIDFWCWRSPNQVPLSIDAKIRAEDYAAKERPEDDLALETWSVCESKVGWTRDPTKQTDFIIWYWVDTGRFFIASFPILCCVFSRHWEEWRSRFKTERQDSNSWQSECVFVPRLLVMERMQAWSNGIVRPKANGRQMDLFPGG